MRLRIAIWAIVGALVVVCLRFYLQSIFPNSLAANRPALDLVYLVCPIALLGHYALNFYSVLLINAATYAVIGWVVETIRRHRVRKLA